MSQRLSRLCIHQLENGVNRQPHLLSDATLPNNQLRRGKP